MRMRLALVLHRPKDNRGAVGGFNPFQHSSSTTSSTTSSTGRSTCAGRPAPLTRIVSDTIGRLALDALAAEGLESAASWGGRSLSPS